MSLGKFGNIPIAYNTGIPRIEIPIYSYQNKFNGLNLAVSLDYHAGGVRVDEISSDVGIGWALNAGGMVSRSMLGGKPDEEANDGFMNEPALPNTNTPTADQSYAFTSLIKLSQGNADYQADVFNFSCGGIIGRFMLGKNNDFVMLTRNKVKVTYTLGSITGSSKTYITSFTITGEDGTQYLFNDIEITHSVALTYPSSWYISKIIAPFSTDTISFNYNTLNITNYYTDEMQSLELQAGVNSTGLLPANSMKTSMPGQDIPQAKQLTLISFPDQTQISFSYDNTQRNDLPGSYLLNKITITNGNFHKGYNLYHDFSLNRPTLLKVLPFDQNNVENPGYSCVYYPGTLPARLSGASDHWGLYNGNSGVYLPSEYIQSNAINLYYNIPPGYYFYLNGGPKREVDTSYQKMGTLHKLAYPTGGFTVFELESNMVYDSVRSIPVPVNGSQVKDTTLYIHLNLNPNTYTNSYTFEGDANSTIKLSLTFPNNTTNPPGSVTQTITNSGGTTINSITRPCGNGNQINNYQYSIANLINGATYTITTTLNNLTNTSFASYSAHLDIVEDHTNSPTLTNIFHPLSGGLRIKSIKDYDGQNANPVSTRLFDYSKDDGLTSSGIQAVYPKYAYVQGIGFFSAGVDPSNCYPGNTSWQGTYITRSSYPLNALSSVEGSAVLYSQVTEKFLNNGNSDGKTVRYYSSYVDYPASQWQSYDYTEFPFTPNPFQDWNYGLLKKELQYTSSGGLLNETDNSYLTTDAFNTNEDFRSITFVPLDYYLPSMDNPGTQPGYDWTTIVGPCHFMMTSFFPNTGRSDLIKTSIIDYRTGGNITTIDSMAYDPTYFSLKTHDHINSKNETYEERYYYPYDYTTGGSLATLLTDNIFTPVISSEYWQINSGGNYLMSGVINNYTSFSSGIRKSATQTFQSVTPVSAATVGVFNPAVLNRAPALFKDYLDISSYSNNGFITNQSLALAPAQSFIWDYKGQQPIAKVKNAAVADIAYTSFEADGSGNWTIGSTARSTTGFSGSKSYPLSGTNTISKSGLTSGITYVLSYWTTGNALTISGTLTGYPIQGATVNGWTYYEHHLTGQTAVTISGSGNLDELRLYPVTAQMTTFTYNPLIGITSSINEKNEITYYEYDSSQRLINVKDMNGNIINHTDYHYQGQ